MRALIKIVGCYLSILILIGVMIFGMETGRILVCIGAILLTIFCLRHSMVETEDIAAIFTRWPDAKKPSLIFGALVSFPALVAFIAAIWNTDISRAFLAILTLEFGFNFVLIGTEEIEPASAK